MLKNKKAPIESSEQRSKCNIILSGKTYKINKLNAIFSYNSLCLCDNKEKLLEYWYLAVESGVKKFIYNVDRVFMERYPKYE